MSAETLPSQHWLRRAAPHAPLALILSVFAVVLFRTAWQSDDAYITFRTVDNFVHGYGLRWNTFERVQGYTHPLWMFLMSAVYFFTREIYCSSLVVSMLLALGTVACVLRRSTTSLMGGVLAVGALLFSNAFIEYSTSGLENPLTCLLLACFIGRYFATEDQPEKILGLAFIAGLCALNRMDTILFFAPALAWRWWRARSFVGLLAVGLGFLPLVAWEAFSLAYYGFLAPNTAYAKLNTGIAAWSMMQQGFGYYLSTFVRDPFSMGVLVAGLLTPFIARDKPGRIIAAGMALYLLYVVRIGGDFMSGRFFAAPVLVSAALLAHAAWRPELAMAVFAALAQLFMAVQYPAIFQGEDYGKDRWTSGQTPPHLPFLDKRYVKDQRGLDFRSTGLLNARHTGWELDHEWAKRGNAYRLLKNNVPHVHGAIGWLGFYSGPDTIIIDWFALTDPLLARLPTNDTTYWYIGHFIRDIPKGYLKTIESGTNTIEDPGVAAYYDKLKLITQGELWTRERWQAIYEMNTGKYEHLLDDYRAKCAAKQRGPLPWTKL